jgi:hypothetical protein
LKDEAVIVGFVGGTAIEVARSGSGDGKKGGGDDEGFARHDEEVILSWTWNLSLGISDLKCLF